MPHVVLNQREKRILHAACDLLRDVDFSVTDTEMAGHESNGEICWCSGECGSPIALALTGLIRSLQERGRVPDYRAQAAKAHSEIAPKESATREIDEAVDPYFSNINQIQRIGDISNCSGGLKGRL